MKRYLSCLLFLGIMLPLCADDRNDSCHTEITSRSYLSVNPVDSANPVFKSAFRNNLAHMREDGWHGAMQLVLFGGKSNKSEDTARYFLPFGKEELLVTERSSVLGGITPDLFAEHFGIFTADFDFESTIAIRPKQSVIGVGFEGRFSFWRNECRGSGLFLDVITSVQHVKNRLNLTENVVEGRSTEVNPDLVDLAPPAVTNMIAAFKQEAWKFGKIDDEADDMTRTGLADIEVKLGYEWLQHEPCHLETYLGILIPTGNAPKSEHLFEAIVGHGKHCGVLFGNNMGVEIWSNECGSSLRMETSTMSKYLFKKKQVRSIDLKYKPWSRYISMYASEEDARAAATLGGILGQNNFTPGINLLTREVDVRPGFMHTMNTALVYQSRGFMGELGYNLYARRSECLKLSDPFPETAAIKDPLGIGQTRPIRDITGNILLEASELTSTRGNLPVALADYQLSVLTENDLDLVSASTPAALAHTVYGAIGYQWESCDYPMFIDFGGSYNFSTSNNSVLDRWMLWGKFGISL